MNKFKKFLLIEFVVFIANVLIGIVAGLLLEKLAGPTHGYFTSSIIGIAGAYLGYTFVYNSLYSAGVEWHAMPARFVGAGIGAVLVLELCRIAAASA
jgi:uncharacterized membrane protein YeaQ/YmgE (transglycosylase-associated protein family)